MEPLDNVHPFTPATAKRGVKRGGGSNQMRVGAYNERLVLSLVRRRGAMSKSEIARHSGLSAQTASVIVRALEDNGLLLRGERQRGGVGQPSVPMRINPRGAFSIGLKIGRGSADVVLIDFVGRVVDRARLVFEYPRPDDIKSFAITSISQFRSRLTADQDARIAGIGISVPFELWKWAVKVGGPADEMEQWQQPGFMDGIETATGLPVHPINDATSACGAELVFGLGRELSDFIYIFIGTFAGGGLVLNDTLFRGRTGNAGALGSLPVPLSGGSSQLGDHASLFELERMLVDRGLDPAAIWAKPDDWGGARDVIRRWIERAAEALAVAAISCCAVLDVRHVVIDGAFPPAIRARLVQAVDQALDRLDLSGIARPEPRSGTIGPDARAIGGASQPLLHRYLLDRDVLFSPGETAQPWGYSP
ncbi:ROK family transcriptional regulator [Ahrensia sp. R2A130]|uniref:ROK family transcriptional regulator n=1 Tax=Ahrensia sp. R2A130 TaxID=744979 RepID=UPI0001E094B9|nr:ROK family transcriptional regulator [Ahrensia sp. R2A130]EFL88160.1 ROK family transcriptional regulator [Ahrensia sp. R2A130]